MSEDRKIFELEIGQIKQKVNSRITYDKEDLSELMVSMRQRGLLSPIGVRKGKDGEYEIAFGNRRLRAAAKLDWKTISCMLVDADTDEDLLVVNAVENMQRVDVPLAEQGRIFYGLKKAGLSEKEISARIGISHKKVQRTMHLYNKIPEELRPKITAGTRGIKISGGTIPATTAGLAIDLSSRLNLPKAKRDELLNFATKKNITGTHMRRIAGLVKAGRTLKQAVNSADGTRIVTISLAIPAEKIRRLEAEYGTRINDILYDVLCKNKWLGIVHAAKAAK